jgi:hypothetical protein
LAGDLGKLKRKKIKDEVSQGYHPLTNHSKTSVMKKLFLFILFALASHLLFAQNKAGYPTPEFMNEVSFLNKENMTLVRLEKGSSKMESKTKMGGMGGGESGYLLEGRQSPVRLQAGNLSFVFYNGSSAANSPRTDSIMSANGMDPSMNAQMTNGMEMMNDPSRTTSLYSMTAEKGSRQVTVRAYGGMKLMGKSKKESTKYTLSIKKIKNGYYEMVVDKPLPRGEYAFVLTSMTSTDGTYLLFAFGID